MRVDEAGRDDAAGIVGDRDIGGQLAPEIVVGPDGFDQAVAADDKAVALMVDRFIRPHQKRRRQTRPARQSAKLYPDIVFDHRSPGDRGLASWLTYQAPSGSISAGPFS